MATIEVRATTEPRSAILIEHWLMLPIALGLAYALTHLWLYGYLPTPFFYEPLDTWMDWFNTAQFAHRPGAYDLWGTIYPPLSFIVLKFTTYGQCYTSNFYEPRDCDYYGIATLHIFYLVNIVLTAKTLIKIDRSTALPRAFALTAGLPMVFALERGNIILLCYTCLLLAYGPLLRSARWRWFFAACAINFKIYLIGTLFAQLLQRRWRWFEGAMLATILVYLLSYAFLGAGTPREIFNNIMYFSASFQATTPLDLMYASTYKPLIYVLEGNGFPVLETLGSGPIDALIFWLPIIIYSVVGLIGIAALAVAFRPGSVPMHRLIFLSIAAALISSEAGHYTTMLLILFIFMEPWRGFGRIWSIVTCYILCIPADIPLFFVPPLVRESYLSGHPVVVEFAVGIGPFIRPGLILSMVVAMSLVTLRQVWDQLRADGWRSPLPWRRTSSLQSVQPR